MFGKGACETIACVVWQWMVLASDSRIDGSILLSLLHFLLIMNDFQFSCTIVPVFFLVPGPNDGS